MMDTKLQYYKAIVSSRNGIAVYERVLFTYHTGDLTFLECRFGPVGIPGVAKIELIPSGEYSDATLEDTGIRRPESQVAGTTTDRDRRE
jgi:hypothetical protein